MADCAGALELNPNCNPNANPNTTITTTLTPTIYLTLNPSHNPTPDRNLMLILNKQHRSHL